MKGLKYYQYAFFACVGVLVGAAAPGLPYGVQSDDPVCGTINETIDAAVGSTGANMTFVGFPKEGQPSAVLAMNSENNRWVLVTIDEDKDEGCLVSYGIGMKIFTSGVE